MKPVFSTHSTRTCPVPAQSLAELSPEVLRQRKRTAEEMLAVVVALALLVVVMAIWSGLYPLALTSFGMQPAFSDYLAKRRAIVNQLTQLGEL